MKVWFIVYMIFRFGVPIGLFVASMAPDHSLRSIVIQLVSTLELCIAIMYTWPWSRQAVVYVCYSCVAASALTMVDNQDGRLRPMDRSDYIHRVVMQVALLRYVVLYIVCSAYYVYWRFYIRQ
jgi:hypothetical protein